MTGAKDVIDGIRRTEFLLDVELPTEAMAGAQNVRGKLHRALRLLSEELYSRETHFVLELVQNADDNLYCPLDIPSICFRLSPDRLEVTNNEAGFAAENVRALCDVGNSTKAKRDGFIGEKGIGFKSVFAICDRPEIHSNDFHFRFDTTAGDLLGYVVPIWLQGHERQIGTRIVLPAKRNHPFTSSTLSELSAQLLLFLRKLRRLEIHNTLSQSVLVAERMDQGHRLTLASTDDSPLNQAKKHSAAKYLRVEHTVSMSDLREDKRPEISESQIVLAFPVNDDGTARTELTQPVFAYLPVRDFGFRFVLQADFLLSSSREDIHKDSPWNIRLRDAISEAFVSAVPHFKSDAQLARTFLHYIPDVFDVVDAFFQQAVERICARLTETECVQSRSGRWCTPDQILLTDSDFQALFSNEDLQRCLELEYPMQAFTPAGRQVLSRLGTPSAAFSHTLALLQDEKTLTQHSGEWFAALYEYLARNYPGEPSLKRMRTVACVRVNGGALKRASKDEIFFPLSRGKRYGFEEDLDIVDSAVLTGPIDRVARIREFLIKLGVHEASPYTLIENHILPQHADDEWKKSKLETLAGHVAYVKDHLSSYVQGHIADGLGTSTASTATARLRAGLYIQTKRADEETTYFDRPHALYLPSEYSPAFVLEEVLGGEVPAGLLVAPTYLEYAPLTDQSSAADIASEWREFFYRGDVGQHLAMDGTGTLTYSDGTTYEGQFRDGRLEGNGVLKSAAGGIRSGAFIDGRLHGKGSIHYQNGAHYEGELRADLPEGQGRLTHANGGFYEGAFVGGHSQGKGKLKYGTGDTYEGDFLAGEPHGTGVFRNVSGDVYDGQFVSGKRHGTGRLTFSIGDVWEGEWKQGKLYGKCRKSTAQAIYDGECVDDHASGLGHYEDRVMQTTYDGAFRYNTFEGEGHLRTPDLEYKGSFRQGLRDGAGKQTEADGTEYEGAFVRGVIHGHGVLRTKTPSGIESRYDGEFVHGKMQGTGTLHLGPVQFKGIFKSNVFNRGTIIAEGGRMFEVDIDQGTVLEVLEGGVKQPLDQLPPDITI